MRSPRTTLQREWLIRTAWRTIGDCPWATLLALHRQGFVCNIDDGPTYTEAGWRWLVAFREGVKSIGGKP